MPSSFTPRLRLEMQAAGENLNTWGAPKLNNVIARVDFSIAGWSTIALTGNYALTASNSDDEARSAMLKFTGAGPYTVTIPSVSKRYDVWNALAAELVLTTGAGAVANLQSGEKCAVICDSVNLHRLQPTDFGGARVTGVADPTGAQDGATKKYVDDVAFSAAAGNLPGQAGNAGRFLTTDGTVAGWGTLKAQNTPTSVSIFAMTSTGAQLGGLYASAPGADVGLVNAAGGLRFLSMPSGRAYLASDAAPGTLNEIATHALAIAYAVSL